MKISIITSSRADFGLLKNLIIDLKKEKFAKVSTVVTGSHFSKKHGNTYEEIIQNKIEIDNKILLTNKAMTPKDLLSDVSILLKKLSIFFNKEKPDILIVLGDRYEIFASAICAYFHNIPIAHLHGGELTNGSLDNDIRHSITKLSQLHFVATERYKKRVIQLGENPKNVFIVGGLGAERILRTKFFSKKKISKLLNINIKKKLILINFQPEILMKDTKTMVSETLIALKKLKDTTLLFTAPGADINNNIIYDLIKKFLKDNSNVYFRKSLGARLFYSCMKISDFMVGNSSSGILEMPSFKKATLNIGSRQDGRLRSNTILDIIAKNQLVSKKIKFIYSEKFQNKLKKSKNLYEKPGTIKKIIDKLKKINKSELVKKSFYDINF